MRFLTVWGLEVEGEGEEGEVEEEGEEEVGRVSDQYVARPFHSQKEVCAVLVRGRRMDVGGR